MAGAGMYVANRDVVVETNKGFVFRFKKDEPKFVPPLVREELLAYGILPVDGDLPVKEEAARPADPMGHERTRLVYENVLKIVETNKPDDFTAGGVPREDAFLRVAGFPAARREINAAFRKYMEEK